MLLLPAQGFGRAQAQAARRHHHHRRYHARNPGCRTPRCDHRVSVRWAREHQPPAPEWAIPAEIVRCESGYTNAAPYETNGASGYYQIKEWYDKGGHGAFYASEHTKAEQDVIARKLYREQGTGPWVSSESCWGGRI